MRYILPPIGLTVAFALLVGSGHFLDVPAFVWWIPGGALMLAVALLMDRLAPGIAQDREHPERLYAVYGRGGALGVEELTPRRRQRGRRAKTTPAPKGTVKKKAKGGRASKRARA